MNLTLGCIPCIVNSLLRLLDSGVIPENDKEPAMRHLLDFLANADYRKSPPALSRELHRMIRSILKNPDPYREIKARHNRMMLNLSPKFKDMVEVSADPFDTAMRLAIAGNVIDFGSQNQLDVMETIDKVVHAPLKTDDSLQLKKDLSQASTVLYVGDNCGEIVLDRLFVETISHPNLYFAVRGSATINDATREDAEMVGMDGLACIITTGDDSPGAVWENTSDEFKSIFRKADVVIAKGQGNLEGLFEVDHNIYYLLTVKCDVIGRRIGAQSGDFVVHRLGNEHRAGRT